MNNLLPEKITALRKHFGYAQADVAGKLNVSVSDYMNWENGNSICRIDQLKELADLFHVPLEELIDNTKMVRMPNLDEVFESVEIPFQSRPEQGENTEVELMPVEGVINEPIDDYPASYEEYETDSLGDTREMNTREFEPTTINQIVADSSVAAAKREVFETQPKSGGGNRKKGIQIALIAGCLLLALASIFFAAKILRRKTPAKEINHLTQVNRLALGDRFSLYINDQGRLVSMGSAPDLSGFDDVVQISAGSDYALGLKKDGTVVCAGNTEACKVNDWKGIRMIAAGYRHSVGLKEDGTVVCAGNSSIGCSVSDWKDIQAVYAGDDLTLGLKKDGTVVTSGTFASEDRIRELKDVKEIAIGLSQIAVVKRDGTYTCYALSTGNTSNTAVWTNMSQPVLGNEFAAGLSGRKVMLATANDELTKGIEKWEGIRYLAARGRTLIAVNGNQEIIGIGDNTHQVYGAGTVPTPSASADTEKLPQVQNVKFTVAAGNLSIKWDTVTNAASYEVKVSTSPETVMKSVKNSTSIPTSKLADGTVYTVTVTAISADPAKYKDSDPLSINYTYAAASVQLDMPKNITAETRESGWRISWTASPNATSYKVKLDQKEYAAQGTSVDIPAAELEERAYNVSVTAVSTDPKYTDSNAASIQLTYSHMTYPVTVKIQYGTTTTETHHLSLKKGTYTYQEAFGSKVQQGWKLSDPNQTITVGTAASLEITVNAEPVAPDPTEAPTPEPTSDTESPEPENKQG